MRYEKAETVLRVALDMQASALGLSLEEIGRNYSEKPLSRRTAERLRDAVERLFPQIEQSNPGEVPKRWRLPGGTVNGLASVTATELADLGTAISLLRRENMDAQAENAAWHRQDARAGEAPRDEPDRARSRSAHRG
jgi:predicted DNA-binding transcriptional regulator YafY